MKPGALTSEFWLTLATLVCATVLLALDKISPNAWAAVTGGSTGVYSLVRGYLKSATAPVNDPSSRPNPAVPAGQ